VKVFRFVGAALVAAMLPLAAQAQDAKDPAIAYRSEIMKSMGASAAALGAIAQKRVPHEKNLALHAESIALAARAALVAFEPKVVGGTAKEDVWTNWKDFSDRMKALDVAATEVANAAKSGGMAAAGPKMQAMLTCKSCHDQYRTK
jgi:cytochrome c556